jgi:hypothetical protein
VAVAVGEADAQLARIALACAGVIVVVKAPIEVGTGVVTAEVTAAEEGVDDVAFPAFHDNNS